MSNVSDVDASLDALAVIAAVRRDDTAGATIILDGYTGPGRDADRGAFIAALVSHAVAIVDAFGKTIGVDPGQILGSVAAGIKHDNPDSE